MNKSIKVIALSLFIISCIICVPAYGRKAQKQTYSSQIWRYNDDARAYEKEKSGSKTNIHEVSYKHDEDAAEQNSDILFIAPAGQYRTFYNPDAKAGTNYVKRAARDFE